MRVREKVRGGGIGKNMLREYEEESKRKKSGWEKGKERFLQGKMVKRKGNRRSEG